MICFLFGSSLGLFFFFFTSSPPLHFPSLFFSSFPLWWFSHAEGRHISNNMSAIIPWYSAKSWICDFQTLVWASRFFSTYTRKFLPNRSATRCVFICRIKPCFFFPVGRLRSSIYECCNNTFVFDTTLVIKRWRIEKPSEQLRQSETVTYQHAINYSATALD